MNILEGQQDIKWEMGADREMRTLDDAIAKLTKGYNVEYIPYNTLAGAKYEMLGMEYKVKEKSNA